MRFRKYIGPVVSLLLLGILLLVFTDPWSTFRSGGKQLLLKDSEGIDMIVISDGRDSTALIKKGSDWLLFGRETVNPVATENLLFAAQRLQITSIVDKQSLAETAMDPFGVRHVKYFKGEKLMQAYDLISQEGKFFIETEHGDQFYMVAIAGYAGEDLEKIFSSSSNHYREHMLIDLLPGEISEVEIALQDGDSFAFIQDEYGDLSCLTGDQNMAIPNDSLDQLAIRLLLSYFTSIRFEQKTGSTSGMSELDLGKTSRLARLKVVARTGDSHTLQVFPYREPGTSEIHMFKALVLYNEDPEPLLVNYIYLDVLMRDLSHYIGEK